MRTIKFRGKDFAGVWWYGYLSSYENNPVIHPLKCVGVSMMVDEETIGQYTGLTDRNGEEIYEGDIIRHKDMVKAYYVVYDGHEFCPNDGFRSLSYPKHWEVIGNIHDNPELLGKKGGE